jgi:hypothetical protein
MRKFILFLAMASVLAMTACKQQFNNEETDSLSSNYAMIGAESSKEFGRPIEITYSVGHTARECSNSCVTINGVSGHVDCQNWGNACVITIRLWPIGGQPKGGSFNALVDTVWELTTEDFFLMPDRSLKVIQDTSEEYLNIPEQLVFRDSVSRQFTFTGLFFSDRPVYLNN